MIDEPTHIVWGAEDTWIPVDRADRLLSLIPGPSKAIVEEAGHLIQLDALAALTAEISTWLGAQR